MQSKIVIGYNQLLAANYITEHQAFSLSAFEDFSRLVEGIVLYDKVILLGSYDLPVSSLTSELVSAGVFERISDRQLLEFTEKPDMQRHFEGSLQKIFGETAITVEDAKPDALIRRRIDPNLFDSLTLNAFFDQVISNNRRNGGFNLQGFREWLQYTLFQTREKGGHFYYFARALVYLAVADVIGADYAPDLLRAPIAALAFSARPPLVSKQLYQALVDKLRSEIEVLDLLGMPVPIFVPPIMAKILSTNPKPKDYPDQILSLRWQFGRFRANYNDFTDLLRDSSVPIKEKLAAKHNLVAAIEGIIEHEKADHALNVMTIWDKVISSDLGISEASIKISLSGIVTLLFEQIKKECVKAKAKALFDLWTDTINLKNYGGLIEKTYGAKIDQAEVEQIKSYSLAVQNIIRGKAIK